MLDISLIYKILGINSTALSSIASNSSYLLLSFPSFDFLVPMLFFTSLASIRMLLPLYAIFKDYIFLEFWYFTPFSTIEA